MDTPSPHPDSLTITDRPRQLATPLESSASPDRSVAADWNKSLARSRYIASRPRIAIPRSASPLERAPLKTRTLRACVLCQKKKAKCDGRKPNCGFCVRSGVTCAYANSKTENHQLHVRSLEGRVEAYESLLREIIARSTRDSRQGVKDAIHSHLEASPDFLSSLLAAKPLVEQQIPQSRSGLSLGRMHQAWHANQHQHERNKSLALLQQPPVRVTSIQHWTSLVDDEVASHLLSLYFTWENPTWQLIDQTLFIRALERRDTRFCSSLLVHTLLFFGCSFSYNLDRLTDRRQEKILGEKLYAAIQRLWSQDKSSRDLPTVQSCILIGLLCCTFGTDRIGTEFIMRGADLGIQLELHQETCPYFSPREDDVPISLSKSQKQVAWAVFEIQTLACQVYRKQPAWTEPPAVKFTQEEATLLDEGVEWRPYPFQTPVSQPFYYTAIWAKHELVSIANDIARLTLSLQLPGSTLSEEYWDFGKKLYQRLQSWVRMIPWSILPRYNTTPHIICLHLYYQSTIAALCEIFLLNSDSPPPTPTSTTPTPSPSPSSSQSTPFHPATAKSSALTTLTLLIHLYKSSHGYKSIPIVMLHYFTLAALYSIPHLGTTTAPPANTSKNQPNWPLTLEISVTGLWYMSLGWGRLCKAFLRTIDLVLKAHLQRSVRTGDAGGNGEFVPEKVKVILGWVGGGLVWTDGDRGALRADYVVLYMDGDGNGHRDRHGERDKEREREGDKGRASGRRFGLGELLAAMEGMDGSTHGSTDGAGTGADAGSDSGEVDGIAGPSSCIE